MWKVAWKRRAQLPCWLSVSKSGNRRFSSFFGRLTGASSVARQRAPQLDLWEIEALLPVMEVSAKVGGSNFFGLRNFCFKFWVLSFEEDFPYLGWRQWILQILGVEKSVCYLWLEDSKNNQGILRRVLSIFPFCFRRFATSGATCGTNWRRSCDVRSGVNWRRNVWQTRPMNCQLA